MEPTKINVLNVGDLEELAVRLSIKEGLEEKGGLAILDLERLGYKKLLGMGTVTKPFSVKVGSYSNSAARKVEEAGGELITIKQERV